MSEPDAAALVAGPPGLEHEWSCLTGPEQQAVRAWFASGEKQHHESTWGLVDGSCECECPRCFSVPEYCLCPDCTDEAHNHLHRRRTTQAAASEPGEQRG